MASFKYHNLVDFLPSKKRNIVLFDRKLSMARRHAKYQEVLTTHYLSDITELLNNNTMLYDMFK